MKNLEDFIAKHRAKFDDKEAPTTLWKKISGHLDDNRLEDFISENKEAFSDKTPDTALWDRIETSINQPKENTSNLNQEKQTKLVPISYLWRMAAAFAVVLIATIWLMLNLNSQYKNRQQDNTATVNETEENESSLAEISPELQDAEIYYESIIQLKKNQVDSYDLVSLGLKEDFKYDINLLDSAYLEIKQEVLKGNTNDMLIKAMVDNLQLRMNILNQQLDILKSLQHNQQEDENKSIQL